MKREDISDALDMLDEEILEHTNLVRSKGENSRLPNWKKWCAMAAGLCLICLIATLAISVSWRNPAGSNLDEAYLHESYFFSELWNSKELADVRGLLDSSGLLSSTELQEPFVPVSSLLASRNSGNIVDAVKVMTAAFAKIPIGEYTGIYEKVYSVDGAILADSIGREVDGAKDWYYISGHLDLQYLIRKENQDYSLWKFGYFNSDEYPYSDVLKLVYRIDSADAIAEIEVQPATMDNSDGGKRIQKEIGLRTITKQDEIETIYQVLCTMTCYGSNRWDLIDYGDAEAAVDAETNHTAVWLGRYLILALDNGNTIDGLKYTAVSNMFYEFSGVAYNPLTKEQAESVREILGIEAKEELKEFNSREPKPLEQDQNQEGETLLYQAENTNASLEYVTELQTKVSNAMINQELPFVTVSAVYENPYRLHVVVTTDSEEELEKLKALDTEGGVLEIEYAAGSINKLQELIEKKSSTN